MDCSFHVPTAPIDSPNRPKSNDIEFLSVEPSCAPSLALSSVENYEFTEPFHPMYQSSVSFITKLTKPAGLALLRGIGFTEALKL
jgi:hypothetical protein